MKDYYYILGVDASSTEQQIKSAHRKLSMKFHPDKNQGDQFFEERFKEIQEAYEILSDVNKRNKYNVLYFSWKNNKNNFDESKFKDYVESLKREVEQLRQEKIESLKREVEKLEQDIKNFNQQKKNSSIPPKNVYSDKQRINSTYKSKSPLNSGCFILFIIIISIIMLSIIIKAFSDL